MSEPTLPATEVTEDTLILSRNTLGKDLMGFCIQEFKAMPKVWQQMSKYEQDDVIDRLRDRVENIARQVVGIIVSDGAVSVIADIEGVAIKDDIKVTMKVSRGNPTDAKQALFDSCNQPCRIILAAAEQYTGGMHEVVGEEDQRSLELSADLEEQQNEAA